MQTEMAKKSGFIRLKNGTVFRALSNAGWKRRGGPRRNAESEAWAFLVDDENWLSENARKKNATPDMLLRFPFLLFR